MGTKIGRLHVRRSAFVNAPAQRVWQEFESVERLRAWFGRGHELDAFEPGPDGRVECSVTIEGVREGFGGAIVVWEAARELTYENNWFGSRAWPVPTYITLRLTPMYGGTQVELFHHGFERLGDAAADNLQGYEAGWTTNHLEALRGIVEA